MTFKDIVEKLKTDPKYLLDHIEYREFIPITRYMEDFYNSKIYGHYRVLYWSNDNCSYYKKARRFVNRGRCSCKEIFMTFGDGEMCQVTGFSSYCPYSVVEYTKGQIRQTHL